MKKPAVAGFSGKDPKLQVLAKQVLVGARFRVDDGGCSWLRDAGLGPVWSIPRIWPVAPVPSSIWVSTAMAILSGRLLEQTMLEVKPMPPVCTPMIPFAALAGCCPRTLELLWYQQRSRRAADATRTG